MLEVVRSILAWVCQIILFWSPIAFAQSEPGSSQTPADRQVVLETSHGEMVLELFPAAAPRHVKTFLDRVRNGFYLGTTFHRAIPYGIVQGGDPLSRDPEKRDLYGTGGLGELAAEFNEISHERGTVSAVLVPGESNSAGSQFFICVTDQAQLDGQYTAFARVVEGFRVLEKISSLPTDETQKLLDRVEIVGLFERDRPGPEVVPFEDTPLKELENYQVVLMTTLGQIEISFLPNVAPHHVRQFLRLCELGIYTGTTFHRVVPGFVIQGGSVSTRKQTLPEKLERYLTNLAPEFSEVKHVQGSVSMARGSELDSAVDSFFIVLAPNEHLDGKYTVFGRVEAGLEVVDGIAQVPLRGEAPMVPVVIEEVLVKKRQ